MSSEHFYSDLPVLEDFSAITDLANYSELPEDWCVITADIQNSTDAIQSGLYKAVNILGVSVITAITNIAKPLTIPYIFGGDGASLCIPERLKHQASHSLITTKLLAQRQYHLNLRIGIIPVEAIKQAGHMVFIARHRISKHYVQAAFAGTGLEYAESLIKSDHTNSQYNLEQQAEHPSADFSGLECRWDNVPSRHGETIALIVKAIAPSIEQSAHIFGEIIAKVRQIYGEDELSKPVYLDGLKPTFNNTKLSFETTIKSFAKGKSAYYWYALIIRIQNVLGWLYMALKLNIAGTAWGNYKPDVISNTDFRKFDGTLREVLSGTSQQREELTNYLEQRYKKNECVYGIHVSSSALITCLISKRSGEHFHFIDGADGGYAMAAAAMKKQMQKNI